MAISLQGCESPMSGSMQVRSRDISRWKCRHGLQSPGIVVGEREIAETQQAMMFIDESILLHSERPASASTRPYESINIPSTSLIHIALPPSTFTPIHFFSIPPPPSPPHLSFDSLLELPTELTRSPSHLLHTNQHLFVVLSNCRWSDRFLGEHLPSKVDSISVSY